MTRIAILGLTHDHVWSNVEQLAAHPDAEIVGVADLNQPLLDKFAEIYPDVPAATDFAELLDAQSPDAVYVFSDNRSSAELSTMALERGLHVLVEKPMAADLAGADAMLAAAQASGKTLMINWPFTWWPALQEGIRRAMSGDIGRLWQVRYRAAHQGPAELGCSEYFVNWLYDEHLNGGGAYMDYCCYGAALASAMLGLPESVTGVTANLVKAGLPVEDNALISMRYPDAMATAEASWTQIGKLTAYQTTFYGTKGTLFVEPRHEGRLLLATADDEEGSVQDVPQLDDHMLDSAHHFLHAIGGGDLHPLADPRTCRDAQAVLDAGMAAAKERREMAI